MASAAKTKSYTFPVVAWDDVDGRDVWIGDVTGTVNDPLAVRYQNEETLARLAAEIGVEVHAVYVVREVPL